MLFVTVSKYEPVGSPAGSVATSLWLVNDTRVSVVVSKTTEGAIPDGLKPFPVMVMRLFDVFPTVL